MFPLWAVEITEAENSLKLDETVICLLNSFYAALFFDSETKESNLE